MSRAEQLDTLFAEFRARIDTLIGPESLPEPAPADPQPDPPPDLPQAHKPRHGGHGIKDGDNRSLEPSYLKYASDWPVSTFLDCVLGWGQLEPKPGVYNFQLLEDNLKAVAKIGKQLVVAKTWKKFNTTNPDGVCPAGLPYFSSPASKGVYARIDNANVADAYIEMLAAFAVRFDDHPNLEIVYTAESVSGFGAQTAPDKYEALPAGFTTKAHATQLKRIYAAGARLYSRSIFCAHINFTGNEVAGLMEVAYQAGCGISFPDARTLKATEMFCGRDSGGEHPQRDYRGLMPCYAIASTDVMQKHYSAEYGSPASIVKWAKDHGVTHLSWVPYFTKPVSMVEIKAAVAASPQLRSL